MDERRRLQRFPLQLSIRLILDGSGVPIPGKTRDVSAAGVFFYVESSISEGSELEFTMTLPQQLTRTAPILVRCQGEVVRVTNHANGGKTGVGVSIFSYDFLAA